MIAIIEVLSGMTDYPRLFTLVVISAQIQAASGARDLVAASCAAIIDSDTPLIDVVLAAVRLECATLVNFASGSIEGNMSMSEAVSTTNASTIDLRRAVILLDDFCVSAS